MYLMPQPFQCEKCGFECNYGEHDPFGAPVLSEGPICPKCYADFLRAHCGVMRYTHSKSGPQEKLPGAHIQSRFR